MMERMIEDPREGGKEGSPRRPALRHCLEAQPDAPSMIPKFHQNP